MKKIISVLLSALMCCSIVLPVAGCVGSNTSISSNSSSAATPTGGYLALSDHNVKLKIGETLSLGVKRYNDEDEEQTIGSLRFSSENSAIVSVSADGTITALHEGETYVNVVADGVEAAVFVTVQGASAISGLAIRFSSQSLYVGVPSQARAVILDEGVTVATAENVTWRVEEDGALEITETGVVTPKELTDSATVKASCEYDGETYTSEIQIAVVEPIYYVLTETNVKLAGDTTLSGEKNEAYTEGEFEIKAIHALSGEINVLGEAEIDLVVVDESVAIASISESNTIEIQAKATGATNVNVTVKENGKTFIVPLEVATPMSTIADMDALAISVYNDAALLSGNYMLVNDIDYEDDVIMPITTSIASTATAGYHAGVQWKYRLTKTEDGYAWVDRKDYGKAGTGLTDEEFKAFDKLHISRFHKPFSGTFDGNGYSILNAAIFYGQWVSYVPTKPQNQSASNSGIFGVLSGTLKNIGFENITMQNPADEKWATCELSEYGLNRVYTDDGTFDEGKLGKSGEFYKANSYSLVCKSEAGALIENVYFNFKKGLGKSSAGQTGTLLSWGTQTTVRNCVLYVEDKAHSGRLAMGDSRADTKSLFTNNLILGMSNFHYNASMNVLGTNGNWWLGDTKTLPEWKDLFTLEAEEGATNVRTVAEVAETFDRSVWNMSSFGARKTGCPKLIKGCSSFVKEPEKIIVEENDDDKKDNLIGSDKEWENLP
ncbi:MAG: Ig-like domain-containing protein [Clostridia bacterium]|nr:Ig-like domain-containing protein [Clostridia bacterium]